MAQHDPDLSRVYTLSVGVKVQMDYLHEPEGPTQQAEREHEQRALDEHVLKMMTCDGVPQQLLAVLGIKTHTGTDEVHLP